MELRMENMQTGLHVFLPGFDKNKINQWNCTKWRSSHTHTWTKTFDIIYCISSELWRERLSFTHSLTPSVNCCKYALWRVALVRVKDALDRARQKSLPLHDRCAGGVFEMHRGSTKMLFRIHSIWMFRVALLLLLFSIFISFFVLVLVSISCLLPS